MELAFLIGISAEFLGVLLHSMLWKQTRRYNFGGGLHMIKSHMVQVVPILTQLIKKREQKILKLAAQILVQSDTHDEFFFNELKSIRADQLPSEVSTIFLGERFAVVKTQEYAKKQTAQIVEPKEDKANEIKR